MVEMYGEGVFKGERGSPEDLARFLKKIRSTEEEALTRKELDWGWKGLGPEDGEAVAHYIKQNKICITLK